jgi:hypothetical protein
VAVWDKTAATLLFHRPARPEQVKMLTSNFFETHDAVQMVARADGRQGDLMARLGSLGQRMPAATDELRSA